MDSGYVFEQPRPTYLQQQISKGAPHDDDLAYMPDDSDFN